MRVCVYVCIFSIRTPITARIRRVKIIASKYYLRLQTKDRPSYVRMMSIHEESSSGEHIPALFEHSVVSLLSSIFFI